jgi:predicted RNA binding protein YcfA (HicA-like mRNA interferase family)
VRFPSLRAQRFLAILLREPLLYEIVRQRGSHRKLRSNAGYPDLGFSFHDRETLPGGLVREILVNDVGLSEEAAFRLV